MSVSSIASATVTPILDRQAPMPPPVKGAGGSGRTILIWFLLAFGATVLFSFWRPPLLSLAARHMRVDVDRFLEGGSLLPFLVLLPLAVLATVYCAILIHELGHILGASSLDYGSVLFACRVFRLIEAALEKLEEAEKMMRANPNEARREISLRFLSAGRTS